MPSLLSDSEKKWSLYPSLHSKVSRLLQEHLLCYSFYKADDPNSCVQAYDTAITGFFKCHNEECESSGWTSKSVSITIRQYPGRKYNARVYHQHCENCKSISRPFLNKTYAERVAYRIKRWEGIEMDLPPYSGRSKGPHQSSLCEGCKDGHCKELEIGRD